MEAHHRAPLERSQLGGQLAIKFLQLGDVGIGAVAVAIGATGVGFHQAIANVLHLFDRQGGIEPHVGVDRFFPIAVGMAMVVVVVVVMAMSVIVLLFHLQGFDPSTAIDRDQFLVFSAFKHRLQKALHAQAIDHQHLGLAEAGHILGTRLVGMAIGTHRQ